MIGLVAIFTYRSSLGQNLALWILAQKRNLETFRDLDGESYLGELAQTAHSFYLLTLRWATKGTSLILE
jgi:hypothetical protein